MLYPRAKRAKSTFVILFMLCMIPLYAHGELNSAQRVTLNTDILVTNSAEFAARVSANDDVAIAASYNLVRTPDFWVWRTRVSRDELVSSTSIDGTVFTHVGNGFIGRSQGEFEAWRNIFSVEGTINYSLPQVRTAIADIFSGVGNAALNKTHLDTVGRRKALRGERLYAAGTGSTASPGLMTFEGQITGCDVARALRNAAC